MRLKVSNVCQLLDKSKYPTTHTKLGCTFTNNGDGSFTINGIIQNGGSWSNSLQQITQNLYGHKILLLTNSTSDIVRGEMKFTLQNGSSKWGTYNSIYTVIYDNYKYLNIRIYMDNVDAGKTIDNATVKFQLFDLTEMYGAGNEPTTVEEFRADFPDDLYEYTPYCWAYMKNIRYIDTTKNLFDYSKVNNLMYIGGFSVNQYFIKNGNKFTVTYPMSKGATYLDYIMPLKAGTYTLSLLAYGTVSGATKGYFGLVKVENDYKVLNYNKYAKSWLSGNDRQSYTLTIEEDGNYAVYAYSDYSNSTNLDSTFWDIQLELGDTATPYQPYGYLPLNRGKYIANKEPVQLLDKSKLKAVTSKNVTATPNTTNGMWTISGAATASEYLQIGVYYPGTDFNIGDKLFLRNSNIDNSVYFPYAGWYDKDNKYLGEYDGAGIFSVTNPEIAYVACYFTTRTVGDINVTTQVQLFNLTRMYGKGNEPTAAEFVAQYPGFDYSVNKYNAITFR